MTVATVCIPWRPTPSRINAYNRVRKFWLNNFSDWPVIVSDSQGDVFNLSQARNLAVAQASTDVVVVADADTIPNVNNIWAAVDKPVGVTWPQDRWILVPNDCTDTAEAKLCYAPQIINRRYPDALGGVFVCTRDDYKFVGGCDERFLGWGCEDYALHAAAITLSRFCQIAGSIYSFDHNDHDGRADSQGWSRGEQSGASTSMFTHRNRGLLDQYLAVIGDRKAMRDLLNAKTRPKINS